jgi:MFS family permease
MATYNGTSARKQGQTLLSAALQSSRCDSPSFVGKQGLTLMVARTSYRTIALLACCQALLLTNAAGLISMSAMIGYDLAPQKSWATLGAATYVIGSALATMPASLWMARVGRRRGFMTGALVNILGCALAITALLAGSFALFCAATAVVGVYNAIGLQYRFAAAEVATLADRPKAISLVLAGGIVGGFLGPYSTVLARDWISAAPFAGSFLLLAAYALVAFAVQSRVHVPKPVIPHDSPSARPLSVIVRQPAFVVAVVAGALGYGLMNLLMVATPLAMSFCSHPYGQAAMVIQWHVVGMYAPGFFTGHLIARLWSVVAWPWRSRATRSPTSSSRWRCSAWAGTSCTRAPPRCSARRTGPTRKPRCRASTTSRSLRRWRSRRCRPARSSPRQGGSG